MIYDEDELIAEDLRKYKKGEDSLFLDHYLMQLSRKPGALWDCAPIKQLTFQPELIELWERLSSRMGHLSASRA